MSDDTLAEFPPERDYERLDPEGAAAAKAQQEEADRKTEERQRLIARSMSDPAFRDWIWQYLRDCHVFETRFASTGYSPDPLGSWLYAGEQKAAWHLWAQIDDAVPELASLMRREHQG